MISYRVIKDAMVGKTRVMLSEKHNGNYMLYELVAYVVNDAQGSFKAERKTFTTMKDVNEALKQAGLTLNDVSVPLYSHEQYAVGAKNQPIPNGRIPLK